MDSGGSCPGPANVCFHACLKIDWTMAVYVSIFIQQILQDRRLTDIEAHQKQSTPTGAADAGIWRNTLATRRVSDQRSAGASDHHHNAHQVERENPGCWQPVHVDMHTVHYAATVPVARIEGAHSPATNHGRPHAASCHPTPSEVYLG